MKPKLLTLHLSDIHFKSPADKNPILSKVGKLSDAIRAIATIHGAKDALLILTGDIAYSGKGEEYAIADQFLQSLVEQVGVKLYPIIVPGNHDCDFALDNKTRSLLLKGISDDCEDIDESIIEGCTNVQKAYRTFENKWLAGEILHSNNIYKKIRIETLDKIKIIVHQLNTAWLSQNPEQQGHLRYPLDFIKHDPADEWADLISVLMHHPGNWFEPTNGRAFSKLVAHTCDLVITGHEHESFVYGKLFSDSANVTYLEAGVLQESSNPHHSSFNIILFDGDSSTSRLLAYEWNKKTAQYEHKINQDATEIYMRNKRRNKRLFNLSEKFNAELEDPGASFQHSLKPNLTIDDIFVCPDFKEVYIAAKTRSETIYGKNLAKYLANNSFVLFTGAEGAGKSTLMKQVFRIFYKQDIIPILLQGKDLNAYDSESLFNAIKQAVLVQYQDPDINTYEQLRPQQRAILIDDYHKIPLKVRQRAQMLEYLTSLFEHVILCGSHESRLEELEATSNTFLKLRILEMLELGYRRRHELIANWFNLGRDGSEVLPERANMALKAEKKINEALGRDLVPSFPLVILVLLSQIEMQTKLDTSPGSQSYLYDVLIKASLSKVKYDYVDADTRYNYLADLAYYMYKTRRFSLSPEEIEDWNQNHAATYDIKLNYERMIEDLISAQILSRRGKAISFRYKYVYYYFAGQYFATNISDSAVRSEIPKMMARLYNEDSANIVMFISYFTNDPLIVDTLLATAGRLFSNYRPCQLDNDVDSLNHFLQNALAERKQYYLSAQGSTEENRLKVLDDQDEGNTAAEIDKSGDGIQIEDGDTDLERQFMDEALQLNASFKTIQILGQIIRTYLGKIKKDPKIQLANETYALGLRALGFSNKIIENNLNSLFDLLVKYISMKREHLQPEEKAALASRYIGGLTEVNAFVIIRYVADSVGNERLANTFRRVLAANSTNAYKLIDLAIKLENSQDSQEFPMKEVEQLAREFADNQLALGLLRRLVWQHFYLFEKEYSVKQKACKVLDIKFENTRLLPAETKHNQ